MHTWESRTPVFRNHLVATPRFRIFEIDLPSETSGVQNWYSRSMTLKNHVVANSRFRIFYLTWEHQYATKRSTRVTIRCTTLYSVTSRRVVLFCSCLADQTSILSMGHTTKYSNVDLGATRPSPPNFNVGTQTDFCEYVEESFLS